MAKIFYGRTLRLFYSFYERTSCLVFSFYEDATECDKISIAKIYNQFMNLKSSALEPEMCSSGECEKDRANEVSNSE